MTATITFTDTETTGLDQAKGDKIIEIALLTYDLHTQALLDKFVQRFDPQMPIHPAAQAVHGISYGELVGQPLWETMAQEIADRIGASHVLGAHNMGFDGPFIAGELIRCGIKVPDVPSVCTMEGARWACPDGKMPKLKELCFALGVEYDTTKAHAADYDVMVTAECFFRGFKRGFYDLPVAAKGIANFRNPYLEAELKAA
jgi:DNA polymerase-3 subunit epsilon